MREIGRGGSGNGKERGAGVTVAAAVAVLERQQEEQRRTAPPVRHRLHGDLSRTTEAGISRDSSDSSVGSVGETIARLQNKYSAGGVAGNVSSPVDAEHKHSADAEHVTRPKLKEFTSARTKEPDKSDVKANRVLTERERGVNEIRKSPSTKNISSLVRNNSVASTLKTATFSSSDANTQDVRKCAGAKLSTGDTGRDPAVWQRLSSAKDILDHCDDCNDDYLGAASLGNETLHHPQFSVEGSTNDGNIPPKRPRVIQLRDAGSKDNRPKSNPEVTSGPGRQRAQSAGGAEGPLSNSSSVKIALEYPPPPPSSPPEYDSRGSPFTGGTSPSNSRCILAATESLGS